MSNSDLPRDPEQEAALMLNLGLKSCRAVISNYRALLMPEQSNDNYPEDADGIESETTAQ